MVMEAAAGLADTIASYLVRPYARLIVPEADGTFRAEILEFPGCIATGDTPEEALTALKDAAADWLEAALERGQTIPDPVENAEFSGRLVLRLPKSLHRKASVLAERDGVSLNQLIVAAVAEYVGEHARTQNQVSVQATISNVGIFVAQNTLQSFGPLTAHGPSTLYPAPFKGMMTTITPLLLDNPIRRIG